MRESSQLWDTQARLTTNHCIITMLGSSWKEYWQGISTVSPTNTSRVSVMVTVTTALTVEENAHHHDTVRFVS